jgi:hypothetical protein
VKGKCVVQNAGNRKKPSCKRNLTAGTLTLEGHSGANKVAFQGLISSTKKLKPGRYTVMITATNSAAQHSNTASLSFTVVR